MKFEDLNLEPNILKAITECGYTVPTQIQQKAIIPALEGRDMIGCAQTGTGKTAAFMLPILSDIDPGKKIRALIVTPTRELAIQIFDNTVVYSKYTGHKTVCIFGGVKQKQQVDKLNKGCDILVATPGRLLDLVNQGIINLHEVDHLVLDEADNMLDMGFINDIKKIIQQLPKKRQNLMFSATMPSDIKILAKQILKDPVEISVDKVASATPLVKQYVYYVEKQEKVKLLLKVMDDKKFMPTIIFTRTKHGANKIAKVLTSKKFKVAAIHGNKSQSSRQNALKDFKSGKINTLVATDIAARGIDIKDIEYVINFEIPNVSETYVHRIGRTGRANQKGISISFADKEERSYIKNIEKLINKKIEVLK